MKNYFKGIIQIVIMAGLLGLVACDKDDPAPIKKAELTSGTGKWKLTAISVTAAGQTVDGYDQLLACEKDDIYYFNADGVYQEQAGATTCSPGEPNILASGTWQIDGKKLVKQISGQISLEEVIKSLDSKTLKTSVTTGVTGQNITINSTYTKQ